MTTLSSLSPAYITVNATAIASDVRSAKTAYVNGGKLTGTGVYSPAMMTFNGSTGYYSHTTLTTAGNKVTMVMRVKMEDYVASTHTFKYIGRVAGSTGKTRIGIYSRPTDDGTNPSTIQFIASNSAGALICRLVSNVTYSNNQLMTIFASFDGDNGLATFYINGADADDTGNAERVAPTTGTMETGASSTVGFGANSNGNNPHQGDGGFFGHSQSYITNWSDFMDSNGNPLNIESTLATVWGGTPLFWNPTGYMEDNKGSAGDMSRNGNVVVSDNDQTPLIPTYTPAMMNYDGVDARYEITSVAWTFTAGWTAVVRVKIAPFTLATWSNNYLFAIQGSSARNQLALIVQASDSGSPNKLAVLCEKSDGTDLANFITTIEIADNELHTVLISFNAATGASHLYVDNVDVHNGGTSIAGTIETGASIKRIGALGGSFRVVNGDVGFLGVHNVYTDFSVEANRLKFTDLVGNPKPLDESGWTEWGSQPLLWHEAGKMDENLGSAGAMTKVGGIILGKGGN